MRTHRAAARCCCTKRACRDLETTPAVDGVTNEAQQQERREELEGVDQGREDVGGVLNGVQFTALARSWNSVREGYWVVFVGVPMCSQPEE